MVQTIQPTHAHTLSQQARKDTAPGESLDPGEELNCGAYGIVGVMRMNHTTLLPIPAEISGPMVLPVLLVVVMVILPALPGVLVGV